MAINKEEKAIVHILYPCYICANEYSGARQVINHVQTIHGYTLTPRRIGHHRPPNIRYTFENDIKKKWDVQHFGCPSCWFHCPKSFEDLMNHIMTDHEPDRIEGFVQNNRDENEFESEEEKVQEIDMTSDEEEYGIETTETHDNGKGEEASRGDKNDIVQGGSVAKGSKNIPQGSKEASQDESTAATNKENIDTHIETQAQIDIVEEIIYKLGDLNDMFNSLFSRKE